MGSACRMLTLRKSYVDLTNLRNVTEFGGGIFVP